MTQKRRLAKVEHSLTPKQVVLRWLQDVRRHPSLHAFVLSLKGKSIGEYPLSVMHKQVGAAVRQAYKGQKRDLLYQALNRAERDVTFLFKVFMHATIRVLEEGYPFNLASLLLHEKLYDLLQRLMLHHEMNEAWRQVSEGMPYPWTRRQRARFRRPYSTTSSRGSSSQ